jgi:hypothetical protein
MSINITSQFDEAESSKAAFLAVALSHGSMFLLTTVEGKSGLEQPILDRQAGRMTAGKLPPVGSNA